MAWPAPGQDEWGSYLHRVRGSGLCPPDGRRGPLTGPPPSDYCRPIKEEKNEVSRGAEILRPQPPAPARRLFVAPAQVVTGNALAIKLVHSLQQPQRARYSA